MKNMKIFAVMMMVLALIASVAVAEYTPSPSIVPISPIRAITGSGDELLIVPADSVDAETGLGQSGVEQPAIILTTLEDELEAGIENGPVKKTYDQLTEAGSVAAFCEKNDISTDLVDLDDCGSVFVCNFRANELALEMYEGEPVTLILENTFGLESMEGHAVHLAEDGVDEVITVEVTDTEVRLPAIVGNLGNYILLDR